MTHACKHVCVPSSAGLTDMNKNERCVGDIAAPRANAGVVFCCCWHGWFGSRRRRPAAPSAAAPIGVQNVIDGIVCGRRQLAVLLLLHGWRAAAARKERLTVLVQSKLVQVLHHEKGERQAGQKEWNAAVQQATACRSGGHSSVRFWLKLWLLDRVLVVEHAITEIYTVVV